MQSINYEIIINDSMALKNDGLINISFKESIFSLSPIQIQNIKFSSNVDNSNQKNYYNFQNVIPQKFEIKSLSINNEEFSGIYYVTNYRIVGDNKKDNLSYYYLELEMIHENQIKMLLQQSRQYSYSDEQFQDIITHYFDSQNINIQKDYIPDFLNMIEKDEPLVIPRGYPFVQVLSNLNSRLYSTNKSFPLIFQNIENEFYITNITNLFNNPIDGSFIKQYIDQIEKDKSTNLINQNFDFENEIIHLRPSMINILNNQNHNSNTVFNLISQNFNKSNQVYSLGSQIPLYNDFIENQNENLINDSITTGNQDYKDLVLHHLYYNKYKNKQFYSYYQNRNTIKNIEFEITFDENKMDKQLKIGRFIELEVRGDQKDLTENFKTINGKYIIRSQEHNINLLNQTYNGKINVVKDYPSSKGDSNYEVGIESKNSLDN